MKILMIGPFPPVVNGVTVSNDFLYRWLVSNGNEVTIINTETGLIASRQGDSMSVSKVFTFLSIYRSLFKVFGKSNVYIAIGQTFWGLVKYSPFIVLCNWIGIPYVLHIHGGYVCRAYKTMTPFKQKLFKRLLTGSKSVIALSAGLAEELKHTFPNTTINVVENFYDPKLIENPIQRTAHEVPRFLFLSNLMLGKGILDFLDALLILKETKRIPFKVAFAGGLEKGISASLTRKIHELGDSVHFFGLADFEKKKELLYWSDIFVLPTWYIMEGQPLSIIEAYVTGNLVVSSHQGGIKDISGYNTFFKTETQNPIQLAETLLQVVQKIPYIKDEIESTKKAAQLRFDSTRFVTEIQDILLGKSQEQEIFQKRAYTISTIYSK